MAPVAETGVEGTAIALDLGVTATGLTGDANTLYSVTLNDIPANATLLDSNGDTLTVTGGSITFDAAEIASGSLIGLTLTPENAGPVTLGVSAIEQDTNGDRSAAAIGSESLTVDPTLPTVAPVAETGVEGTAIALDLGVTATGLTGDANTLYSVTLNDIPANATLLDSNGDTLTVTGGSITFDAAEIASGSLIGLTLTPENAGPVTLGVSAIEQDTNGDRSAAAIGSESLTVDPTLPTVAPVAETGVEGTAIALDLGVTATGLTGDANTLYSVTLNDIPANATLLDSNGDTLTVTGGSITFDAAEIASGSLIGLTLTPENAGPVTLGVSAIEQDTNGDRSAAAIGSESLTVDPTLPTVAPVAETGVEGTAIALDLGVTATGLTGDANTLYSVTLNDIPANATLLDSNGDTLTVTGGSITFDAAEIASGSLIGLTLTPENAGPVTLGVSAIEQDTNGDRSAAAIGSESLTVDPTLPTVAPVAETGVEGTAIALDLGVTATGLTGDANTLYSVTLNDIPANATLLDSNGDTLTVTGGSITFDAAEIASGSLIGLTLTPENAGPVTLGARRSSRTPTATAARRRSAARASRSTRRCRRWRRLRRRVSKARR